MPAFASLSAISVAALKVASLNLCTDEYLLLLARPGEIASVSRLAQDPLESPLWRAARRHHGNRGALEHVLGQQPTLLLTMGGGGRSTAMLARRLGLATLDLPSPASVDDVARNLRTLSQALGAPDRARPWLERIDQLKRRAQPDLPDTIWLSGGGASIAAGSPQAEWLALAGYRQRRLAQGRASLETLLLNPPQVIVRSDYRSGQLSLGRRWLDHPLLRRLESRTLRTDGRPWTCGGPLMIGEAERLRAGRR